MVTTSFASPDVAGSVGTVTVTAKDPYGNTAGSGPDQYEGTVDLTSTDGRVGGLPSSYPFTAGDAGSHIFTNVVLETEGSQTVTATDSVTGTVAGASHTIDVVPAAASQVAIAGAPLTLVAGSTGQLTVQLEDPYGNTGATSTTAQTIGLSTTSSGGALYASQSGTTPITSVAITAGTSTVTVYYGDTQAGTPTISASDPALKSAPTQDETVVPAAADHFTVTTSFTSPDVAGTVGTVIITAYDKYNNRVGSGANEYAGTVDLASSDGQTAGLPATYAFTAADAGSHTFTNVVLKTAGSQSITATDLVRGAITGKTTVTVTAAAATHLVFTTPPPDPIVAGQAFTVVNSAEDPYGNVDTSFNGGVTITLPDQPSTTVTAQARNGVATFAGLTLDATAQGGSIQVSGGGLTAGSTGPVSVNGGSTSQGGGSNGPETAPHRPHRPRRSPASRPDVPEKEEEGQAGGQGRAARLHARFQHDDERGDRRLRRQLSNRRDTHEARQEEDRTRAHAGLLHRGLQRGDQLRHIDPRGEAGVRQGGPNHGELRAPFPARVVSAWIRATPSSPSRRRGRVSRWDNALNIVLSMLHVNIR